MRSYQRSDEPGTMFLGDSYSCLCSHVHGYICRQCLRIYGLLVSPRIAVWIFGRRLFYSLSISRIWGIPREVLHYFFSRILSLIFIQFIYNFNYIAIVLPQP